MKIMITAQGPDMTSGIDKRFGRAGYFILHDTDENTWTPKDNEQNLNAAQGAGIQSAAQVVNSGCEVLISGHCGPKAFTVLEKAGVAVYATTAETVLDAVKQFREGGCTRMENADVEGHW